MTACVACIDQAMPAAVLVFMLFVGAVLASAQTASKLKLKTC